MKITRRQALVAAAGAGPAFVARAHSQTRQEKGRDLVMRSLEALGGDAFLDIRTQNTTGRAYSFYRAQVGGLARITIYDRFEPMQPDMPPDWLPVSRKEIYTEKGDYYALFQNGEGWEVTFQGARPLPEDVMQRYRLRVQRDFLYFLRYRLDEKGLYFYHPGMEIVDNTPTNAVEITDYDGETMTVYLRQSDGLPHQSLYLRRDPKTRIPYEEKTIWSKYRRASNGATLPWNVRRERDGEKTFEQFASSVEVNAKQPEDAYRLPPGIEILPANP